MLDRPRRLTLAWSVACFALFGVLALLAVRDRTPLRGFDDLGRTAEDWADDHDALVDGAGVDRGGDGARSR